MDAPTAPVANLAAGKTRFVLYNRSGNELRVESRTQNLYTKTMDSTIYLCAVADAGQVLPPKS